MNRTLPLLLLLLVPALGVRADDLVIFGEHDFHSAGGTAPAHLGPERAAFFSRSSADLAHPGAFESARPLVNPPAWGKTVGPATHGLLHFHPAFAHGFECRLELEGLAPGHAYILCLNGNPALAGNALLPLLVPGNSVERYYDFLIVTTDAGGRFAGNLGIFLNPGAYDVRCYVKDTADFKIVLYRDYFPFTVL